LLVAIKLIACIKRAVKLYQPNMSKDAGVYRINVGAFFYIGSTTFLGSRVSDHRTRLEKGEHPVPALQQAWNEIRTFEAVLIKAVPRKAHDTDKDHSDRLRFHEDALIRKLHGTEGCCNRSTTVYYNSDVGGNLGEKWKDPEYRARMITILKGREFSDETRAKMAEAKTGKNNPNARACIIHFGGESLKFDSATEAAAHYGVTQQAMDGWLGGKSGWPTADGKTRQQNRRLAGMTGEYL
jgi:hypothetical protein